MGTNSKTLLACQLMGLNNENSFILAPSQPPYAKTSILTRAFKYLSQPANRRDGGGSSEYGLEILSYLPTKPIASSASHIRAESASERVRGAELIRWKEAPGNGETYTKKRSSTFNGPVAVLIAPQTFSAAEDFLVSYDLMKRGLIIGEASGGSTGQPLSLKLPGGGSARISSNAILTPTAELL